MYKRIKCIVYGCGKGLEELLCGSNFGTKLFEILAITDKKFDDYTEDKLIHEKIEYTCIKRQDIPKYKFDIVLVTSDIYYEEIKNDILKMNLCQETQIKSLPTLILDYLKTNHEINFETQIGVDVGGPSQIFNEIYRCLRNIDIVNYNKNNIWSELGNAFCFEGNELGKVIENDATMLIDIPNEMYDVVLSSNNLEHIANPLKAVAEWIRILKHQGLLIVLVPAREFTFDHNRDVVLFEHLLDDYKSDIDESDLTHLQEILDLHDISRDCGVESYEEFEERSKCNYKNRCLHHHVFDNYVLRDVMEYFNMEVCLDGILYKKNWVMIAKKVSNNCGCR